MPDDQSEMKGGDRGPRPNWDMCEQDLYWSANHDFERFQRHGHALIVKANPRLNAFVGLLASQKHNAGASRNYERCHTADQERFWKIAFDVWDVHGPKLDA